MALDRNKYLRADERKAVLDHLDREAIIGRAKGHRLPVRDTDARDRPAHEVPLGRVQVAARRG